MNNRANPVPISEWASRLHPRLRPIHLLDAAAVVLLVAILVWIVPMALNANAHKHTRLEMCSVSMALKNYSDVHGHLPDSVVRKQPAAESKDAGPPDEAAGPKLYSWRVGIVPYLQSWHGTWDPSQPWDSPANRPLVELSSFYAFDATESNGHPRSFPETNLLAITGPGTAFGDGQERPRALKDVPPATIIAVETRSSGIPWPAPGDFDIRTMPRTICALDGNGISSRNAGGFHVIFADGWVWLLSDKVPFETLSQFFTMADAEKHDRDEVLEPYALHRGP